MKNKQPNNAMHGVTLKDIVERLVSHYGWMTLGKRIKVGCFTTNPSLKSSLKFLRKTPWARKEVEELFAEMVRQEKMKEQKNVWKKG
jgi:uncharacterized protein (DUF2132 family)